MITANENIKGMINSPVRKITAKVELYEGSTLVDTFSYNDKLMNFTVERVCEEGKFFGFGICQHAQVQVLDVNREIDYINTKYSMKISYGVNGVYTQAHPTFYITQSRRDEKTNELVIYGYDLIYPASAHNVSEISIETPYTLEAFAAKVAEKLKSTAIFRRLGEAETNRTTTYPTGANFDGSESLREALDDIAEATQTIYYVDNEDNIVFKRLDKDAAPDLTISKADYIELDTKDGKRLATIISATELGDNYSASTPTTGSTQYVRDNAFWDIREDVATLVDNALAAVGGLSIRQFGCEWRGNFLLEPGDKIEIIAKDDSSIITYLLDDVIEYNGSLSETSQWSFNEDDAESASNPTSLGDVLKSTYAKVDKVNKQIDIIASETDALNQSVGSLMVNTESINATVRSMKTTTQDSLNNINENISTLTQQVNASMSAEDIKFEIQKEINETGANKVITTTGFTFNEEGLTISKSGSEMTTLITEDGMRVYRDNNEVLTADNVGVKATNLHATTFLIIGGTSRFEDYDGGARTGCFWVGQ